MNQQLEHFLLYAINDDWAAIAEFDADVRQITPTEYSRTAVLDVIRDLASCGYIRLGAFPGNGQSWAAWDVPLSEAIDRIALGYNGAVGYLDLTEDAIGSNEVFRAEITDKGRQRLAELGDPYTIYSDPWATDSAR